MASSSRNTCAFGHVAKGAVSVVVVQRVAIIVRDVNIFEAVVIVIPDRDTHATAVLRHSREAGLFGHIRERAVGVLMIQTIPEFVIGLVWRFAFGQGIVDLCAVNKKDVQTAVVVIVEERNTSPHCLD